MEIIFDLFTWIFNLISYICILIVIYLLITTWIVQQDCVFRDSPKKFILEFLDIMYRDIESKRFHLQRYIHCWIERHWKGFSYCDRWQLDYFIADLLARALKEFRDSPHDGGPGSLKKSENWDDILTTMVEGFEAAKEISENHHTEELDRKFNLGMKNFQKYFFHLWT